MLVGTLRVQEGTMIREMQQQNRREEPFLLHPLQTLGYGSPSHV